MRGISYHTPYRLKLKDGTECIATLVHINTQYNTWCKEPDVWRREEPAPGRKMHIQQKEVAEVIEI